MRIDSWLPTSGHTGSALTHLEGGLSKQIYDADSLINTDPADGKPLLARYDLAKAKSALSADTIQRRRLGGLWRWHEILPVRLWNSVFTLGEGSTPLLEARRLGKHFGVETLHMKCESTNPTGSFKARGMAVAVSRAAELGATRLVAPSAGNAAGALAAYAAVAGLPAVVIMPSDAPTANQVEVLATGAELILMDGLITDCGRLARLISEELDAFDLSTLKEPYRVEGKKTLGFELAEDLNWELPDVLIYPTGGGTGLVGMWKAFDELQTLGLIGSSRPRMFSVQSEGCAPIVRAFEAGTKFAEPWLNAETRAGGLRVPSAIGDFLILECLRSSKGGAVAVPENELGRTQRLAGALGCGYLSLETAAAIAAVPELLATGNISRDDRIVVFDTGSGFKSEVDIDHGLRRRVSTDQSQWELIVEGLRASSRNSP